MTRVECFIGCTACKTVLFRVDSVERAGTKAEDHTGVFEHVLVKLGAQGDRWKCVDCDGNLERVPAPAKLYNAYDSPAGETDVVTAAPNVDDVNIVPRETTVKLPTAPGT